MTSEPSDWTGSSWERVCRDLFRGDEARMLAWGRRYVAAYPGVNDREFHLGAAFRHIVGPRNREQWWRKAVALLEERSGLPPGPAVGEGAPARMLHAVAVGEAPPPVYAAPRIRIHYPPGTAGDRLKAFDEAMERADRRARGEPGFPRHRPPADRGWTREELYERGRRT